MGADPWKRRPPPEAGLGGTKRYYSSEVEARGPRKVEAEEAQTPTDQTAEQLLEIRTILQSQTKEISNLRTYLESASKTARHHLEREETANHHKKREAELPRFRGVCHQFRDKGYCARQERCPFDHVRGRKECRNAAYLDTGCCSEHQSCPHVHIFDEAKYGKKPLAIQRMLQGVREGKYSCTPSAHVYWLEEYVGADHEGGEKNRSWG
mgnify:CR=1 FL=1